jgi:hypothetical protein
MNGSETTLVKYLNDRQSPMSKDRLKAAHKKPPIGQQMRFVIPFSQKCAVSLRFS